SWWARAARPWSRRGRTPTGTTRSPPTPSRTGTPTGPSGTSTGWPRCGRTIGPSPPAAAGSWRPLAAGARPPQPMTPPPARPGAPRDRADWLRAAAADDEAAGRYNQGLWNLDRAVQLTPEDWVPYAARAALADQAGNAARARADMDEAIRLGAEATVIVQAV